MKKYFIGGLVPFLILFGLSYGLIKAADVEIILGTSSAFNVVRGTDVSSGTKMLYVGSSTVSIGTTTQSAMLTIVGSSTASSASSLSARNSSGTYTLDVRNDGAVLIGTNTSTLNSALYVGSATSGSLGTITAGFLSMGTISANASLHGTTTVRFLADIFANGTVTASKFSGDGSSLTGITATSLGSTSNINTTGTINAGSTTVSVLTTTGSATVTGTLTAANNTFTVNGNTGSMTASSITVSTGTLTVASGAFKVDETGSMTAARVTASSMTVTTGTLTAANGAFKVDETGSMTARSIMVSTGTLTAGQGAFKVDETGSMTAARVTVPSGTVTAKFLSVGTVSTSADGTTTVRFLADIFANGTITASKFSGDGAGLTGITATGGVTGGNISTSGTISAGSTTVSTLTTTGSSTVSNTLTAASNTFRADSGSVTVTTRVGIGTSTPSSSYKLQVTDDADLGFVVGSSGSITAKTLTVTGSATVTGTLTAASNTFRADSGSVTVTTRVGIGTSTPSSSYKLQVTDDADLGFVVGSSGTITAKTLTITGSATVTGTLTAAVGAGSRVGIGTTTPSSAYMLQITDSSDLGVVVGSSGSITAKTITSTGSITVANNGTITAGFLSVGTITASVSLHGTTTVHFPGGINVTGPKNFLIPHPDPQKRDMGWVLRHSCVESPTRGDTLYRYKVEIESDGREAFIDLPSYWLYLNENSEVWVSPVGQFAQGYGYVDEVLNKLVLKGEKKGFYNVLLIGTRKDQYAKAFDAKGVEYIDPAINELLTRGEKKSAGEIQLIDTQNDHVIKNFMDPIVDRFGLATHQ